MVGITILLHPGLDRRRPTLLNSCKSHSVSDTSLRPKKTQLVSHDPLSMRRWEWKGWNWASDPECRG